MKKALTALSFAMLIGIGTQAQTTATKQAASTNVETLKITGTVQKDAYYLKPAPGTPPQITGWVVDITDAKGKLYHNGVSEAEAKKIKRPAR